MSNIIDSIQLSGVTYQIQGSGGGGITSGEVQTMIDESISGKADTNNTVQSIGLSTLADGKSITAVIPSGNTYTATIFKVGNGLTWQGYNSTIVVDTSKIAQKTDIPTVSSAITSGDTNAVAGGAVYDKFDEIEQVTAAALNELNDKIEEGGGGNPTVELTQAEYDALVESGAVQSNTYYIITDAQAGDLTNYYTKTETNTLLGGKQATLVSGTNIKTINNESILGSGNIDIQGGSTYTAGRGIDITNDTVSFDLPISATTLGLECFNSVSNSKTGDSSTFNNVVVGSYNTIGGNGQRREFRDNFIWGNNNKIIDNNWKYDKSSTVNIICGYGNIITGESNSYTSIFGYYNNSYKGNQALFGYYNNSINQYETSFGRYNNSVSASATFGDSGNTLFSVGNGTSTSARHNAFEIRQNGDIYLTKDGQDVKLQDQLGGSSITVDTALDSGSTNPVENRVIYNKIDEVEQVTAAALNELNDKFGGLKLVKLTQQEYDALTTKDNNTLYVIV